MKRELVDKRHVEKAVQYAKWCERVYKCEATVDRLIKAVKVNADKWNTKQLEHHRGRLTGLKLNVPRKP